MKLKPAWFHAAFALALLLPPWAAARADEPGRGKTGPFEVQFLEFIIDHHFAALRMTELAAGTQQTPPGAPVSPDDRTSPSPGFSPTGPKATLDEIKGLARRNNRMQREEILEAQRFLHDWYGVRYEPHISPTNEHLIDVLEQAPPGDNFNVKFLELFSRHHYTATVHAMNCLVGSDVRHVDLERYCRNILQSQP